MWLRVNNCNKGAAQKVRSKPDRAKTFYRYLTPTPHAAPCQLQSCLKESVAANENGRAAIVCVCEPQMSIRNKDTLGCLCGPLLVLILLVGCE